MNKCKHGEEIVYIPGVKRFWQHQTIGPCCRCCGADLFYENIMSDSDDLFCLRCKPDLENMKPITDKIQ